MESSNGEQEDDVGLPALRSMGCERRQPSLERTEETTSFKDSQVQIRPGGGEVPHEPLKLL